MAYRFFLRFLCSVLLLLYTGCTEQTQKEEKENTSPPEAAVDVTIAIPPEIRQFVKDAGTALLEADVKLPNGAPVRPSYVEAPALLASDHIASGKMKVDGWITQRSLAELTNASIRNLGARQINCMPLFATPLVLAAKAETPLALGLSSSMLPIERLISFHEESKNLGKLGFRFEDPAASSTGLYALLQLEAMSASASNADALFFNATSGYGSSSEELLRSLADVPSPHHNFVLTGERNVAVFNAARPGQSAQIVALYPDTGSIWLDYQLCQSDVEWVNASKQAAIKTIGEFFARQTASIAEQEGFRPVVGQTTSAQTLSSDNGVTVELPDKTIPPVTIAAINAVLTEWKELTRPASLVFVLDTSGSLEEEGLGALIGAVQNVVSRLSLTDLMSIVTISTEAEVRLEPTNDRTAFIDALGRLESLGGTALYDALIQGVHLAARQTPPEYRSAVIVIVDGTDKNSQTSAELARHSVRQSVLSRQIPLYFVTLTDGGSDFTSLRNFAAEVYGTVIPATKESLPAVLEQIWHQL